MERLKFVGRVLALLFLGMGTSHARTPKEPPVSAETLIGTWEAIEPGSHQLYVLRVVAVQPSKIRLAMLTGPGGNPVAIVYRATRVTLDKVGQFVMAGVGEGADGGFSVELHASGTAFGQSGGMKGTILFRRPGNGSASRRPITFVKSNDGMAKWLLFARTKAEEILAADTATGGTPQPDSGAPPRNEKEGRQH